MSIIKPKRNYCSWCGRMKFLLPEGVCGFCIEDETRLEVLARARRIDRLANKRNRSLADLGDTNSPRG